MKRLNVLVLVHVLQMSPIIIKIKKKKNFFVKFVIVFVQNFVFRKKVHIQLQNMTVLIYCAYVKLGKTFHCIFKKNTYITKS